MNNASELEISIVKLLKETCEMFDNACMTLHIGRDNGITPQAAIAIKNAWKQANLVLFQITGRKSREDWANSIEKSDWSEGFKP